VDSLKPSEVDQEEVPIHHPFEGFVACHPTKLVIHPDLANIGNIKEEVPSHQALAEYMDTTETVRMQESVVWEA